MRKATAKTRAPILTQNTSNDAVLRKNAFWELRKNIQGLDNHFPQNRHFRAPFRRARLFFRPKTALKLDGSRVNDLQSSSEPNKSCIVNRQIGVGYSKNVIVFDPYSRVT